MFFHKHVHLQMAWNSSNTARSNPSSMKKNGGWMDQLVMMLGAMGEFCRWRLCLSQQSCVMWLADIYIDVSRYKKVLSCLYSTCISVTFRYLVNAVYNSMELGFVCATRFQSVHLIIMGDTETARYDYYISAVPYSRYLSECRDHNLIAKTAGTNPLPSSSGIVSLLTLLHFPSKLTAAAIVPDTMLSWPYLSINRRSRPLWVYTIK